MSIDHELDEAVEVPESLPLGAIFLEEEGKFLAGGSKPPVLKVKWSGPREEWRDHCPYWCRPGILTRREIGDCYAMVADGILMRTQPFPGDDSYDAESVFPELRFSQVQCDQALQWRLVLHL